MTRERAPLPYPWRDIRERLQARQWDLYAKLNLKGPKSPGVFTPLNPTRRDKSPGSFVIYTDGDRAGGWVEYGDVGQPKGDVLQLVQYCRKLGGIIDAYWWSVDFLGLDRKGNGAQPRDAKAEDLERRERERERLAWERQEQAKRDEKAARAKSWWLSAAPIEGTPAEIYLREARGLPLERVAGALGALRFAPIDYIDPETGEVTTWPGMLSAMAKFGAGVRALHRTYLQPDGRGKAPVGNGGKLTFGDMRGAAVRLTKGVHKKSPEQAAKAGITDEVLAIGEGIETMLSVAVAKPTWRVWAAGSLGNLGLVEWPPTAAAVVLVADNDPADSGAAAAFARVEAKWREQARGRRVVVFRAPPGFKDINDWLKGAAA